MRALIAEPLLIIQANSGASRSTMSAATGLAVSLTGIGSLVGLVLVLTTGLDAIGWLLISLPVLIWQDLLRYCAFSLGRHVEALLSDGTWLLALLGVGGALLVLGHRPSVTEWLLLWAASALLAALLASIRLDLWPSPRGHGAWWSRSRRQASPMLGGFAVTTARENLFIFLLPLVTSFAVLGQVKAAMVVNGPVSILMTAASISALPALARSSGTNGSVPVRTGGQIGVGMAAVAGCYGLALLATPSVWGQLFGEAWVGVGALPALIAFSYAVTCLGQGAVLVLMAIGEPARLLRARVALIPVGVLLPLGAARFGDLPLLGIATIVSSVIHSAVWWWIVIRLDRRVPDVEVALQRAEEAPRPGTGHSEN
jgi:O-antigen/teichoic acid export membrane protein